MALKKLTPKDEFLKLNNLINDKEVNKAIEENCLTQWADDKKDWEAISNDPNNLHRNPKKGIYSKHIRTQEQELEALVDLQIMTDRNNK